MTPKTSHSDLRERFRACLLAGALGDALGYPIEFEHVWRVIADEHGATAPARLAYASTDGLALVSDDTQMTLFVAEGFIRAAQRFDNRGISNTATCIERALLRWRATQGLDRSRLEERQLGGWLLDEPRLHHCRAPGSTNMSALTSLADHRRADNNSKGCGALMRSAPIGLGCGSSSGAFELARDSAASTHGHPSGYLSAAYFAALIQRVTRGDALPEAMTHADALLAREDKGAEVADAIASARALAAQGVPNPDALETLGGGWVAEEALAIALACALTTTGSSAEATAATLWRSVLHGGDSDSTGSITGNLLGAMYGASCLPAQWLEQLELRDVVERISEDLFQRRVLDQTLDTRDYPTY